MSLAHIEDIFKDYKDRFYHYLVPWVVDDLRNRNIVIETRKEKKSMLQTISSWGNVDYLDFEEQQIILDSIYRYFEFVFPEDTFPHIEWGTKNKLATYVSGKPFGKTSRKQIIGEIHVYVDNNNIIQLIFHYLRGQFKGHEIEEDKGVYVNYEEELNDLRKEILLEPLRKIINEKLKNKQHTSYNEFINEKGVKVLNLPDDIKDSGYFIYETEWKQKLKENERPHIRRPKAMTAKEFIMFNIIDAENPEDNQKTIDEINILTFKYPKNGKTLDELYQYYLQQRRIKFTSQQRKQTNAFNSKMDFGDFINNIGYKDSKKKLALMNINYANIPIKEIKFTKPIKKSMMINHFPLKENMKKYCLHTIAPRHSYIIDLMFENHNKYVYLVAININTRKLWVEQTNLDIKPNEDEIEDENDEKYIKRVKQEMKNGGKSAENVKLALERMIKQGMIIKHLKGDGESAFKSKLMEKYLENVLKIEPYEEVEREPKTKYPEFMYENHMVKSMRNKKGDEWKKDPKHSSLAILDRVIRTIRDLAFNMNKGIITPKIMKIIVWQYNNAPHATLSKYAGYPVSPNEVDNDEDLERFIVRKIHQENYNIMSQYGFNIEDGTKVKVYNNRPAMGKRRSELEPNQWRVIGNSGPLFELINENGEKQIKSRYQISPIY